MSTYTQYELPFLEAEESTVGEPGRMEDLQGKDEQLIVSHALQILTRRHQKGELLTNPESTKTFLQLRLAEQHNEVFGCIFLTTRHCIIEVEELFFGTIDGATVHTRVIVQKALLHNAAAILAYHNHPSGCAEPSQADINLTQRVKEALSLVDIRLLDHLVVSAGACVSFAERGLI